MPASGIPSWAIAIAIVVAIVALSAAVYFVFRKKSRKRGAVGAQSEQYIEKDTTPSSIYIKPLTAYSEGINDASTIKDSQLSSPSPLNDSSSSIPSTAPVSPYSYAPGSYDDRKYSIDEKKSRYLPENKNVLDTIILQMPNSAKEVDNAYAWNDTAANCQPAETPIENVKIFLPLPPPSSSFFADKMELDSDEANSLYASYMNVSAQQDYVSIDLDEKPFLSSAANNIQQKASTIRNTLKQSLRRKPSIGGTKKPRPLSQFFDFASIGSGSPNTPSVPANKSPKGDAESTRMSRQSSSTSSKYPWTSLQNSSTPSMPANLHSSSPRTESPTSSDYFGKLNKSKTSLVSRHLNTSNATFEEDDSTSSKIMIDTIPHKQSYFSLPTSPSTPSTPSPLIMKKTIQQQQQEQSNIIQQTVADYSAMVEEINRNVKGFNDDADSDISKENENAESDGDESIVSSNQRAASAARRVIRSASRKSRTRSVVVSEEDSQAMFALITANGATAAGSPSSEVPTVSQQKYGTIRKKGNIEIDTSASGIAVSATSTKRKEKNDEEAQRSSIMDIRQWSTGSSKNSNKNNKGGDSSVSPSQKRTIMSSTISGSATVSGKKAGRSKDFLNGDSDNMFMSGNATLGRNSERFDENKRQDVKSLRNLFSKDDPDANSTYTSKRNANPIDDGSSSVGYSTYSKADSRLSVLTVTAETMNSQHINSENSFHEDDNQSDNLTMEAPSSPVTLESSSPYSSKNNTLKKMGNNVDAIRRMLQSSWSGNDLKESGSSSSISSSVGDRTSSYMGSVGSSSFRPVASPLGSVNPRLQNQQLLSMSLKKSSNQQANGRNRPSMPIGFMMNEERGLEGPEPTASFSSSTVRTMIPDQEEESTADQSRLKMHEKKSMMGNILGSRQNNRSIQPSKLGDGKKSLDSLNKKQQQLQQKTKTPAQKERERYLKSLDN